MTFFYTCSHIYLIPQECDIDLLILISKEVTHDLNRQYSEPVHCSATVFGVLIFTMYVCISDITCNV